MSSLLIDIGPLCDCHSDDVLEDMHKALSDPGPDDVWRPHESAYIRELIEQATKKGLAQLDGLKEELAHFLHRTKFGPSAPKPVIADGMVRWSDNLLGAVKAYLEGIPEASWVLSDYQLMADYLVQKYLPPEFAITQAEWLTKRAVLMGKVQSVHASLTPEMAATMLAMWRDNKELEAAMRKSGLQNAILEYGQAKTADYIVSLSEKVRHAIKRNIFEYQKARMLGEKVDKTSLHQSLFDEFAEMNRDWRRIALTEAGEMANQGFVASCKPGEKIKRIEQYANACPFCRKWDGKVLTVVPADKKDKDWQTEVWEGKNNVGRSASPYKRVGGQLVKRPEAEMWAPAAGTFHPHCRGTWVKLGEGVKADEFSLWLDGFLVEQQKKWEAS